MTAGESIKLLEDALRDLHKDKVMDIFGYI